jgi:hypothetical protein
VCNRSGAARNDSSGKNWGNLKRSEKDERDKELKQRGEGRLQARADELAKLKE